MQKDQIKTENKLHSVYKINCMDCDKCYVGQSQRLVSTRRDEHQKNINHDPKNHNVITKHILANTHKIDWKNIEVLHTENNWKKRTIAEMYYIKKQGSSATNKITDLNNFPPCYDSIIEQL